MSKWFSTERRSTLLGKNLNRYTEMEVPGTVEYLIDELKEKRHKPAPGADLLLPNVYDELMADVIDVKDLGSGVNGGTECDHLAFRNKDVDWQIWIARGEHPYPCRYVVTDKQVDRAPRYTIQIRDWKTGTDVAGLEAGEGLAIPGVHSFVSTAEARVGRCLTPVSVAGAAPVAALRGRCV
ncbi:DUF2092 domain-containing protein [Rhizobium favelukesii]|uniref:Uncharacterized protein n=1 Tax=Rhizobium favelukesii TaxID=348824 RepID=W6RPB5_9HYPH|nr:DUF2092 domain-containing protein [Rhizobium favelukesii]CDM61995.1 hypothetical protein LPU83_pLPU83d_0624 [Rhizobium favelukesii]